MTDDLRERFDRKFLAQGGLVQKAEQEWNDYCAKTNGFVPQFWCSRFFPFDEMLTFIQSERQEAYEEGYQEGYAMAQPSRFHIEQVKRERTEEIIDWLIEHDMPEAGPRFAEGLRLKFLTNNPKKT